MRVSMRYGGGSRARGAQMGTGLKNLLSGVSWEDGYVSSSGALSVPSTNGQAERTSGYIAIEADATTALLAVVRHSANSEPWIGIGHYTAELEVASPTRTTFSTKYTKDGVVYTWGILNITNSKTAYIRFSCRTWEDPNCQAFLLDITNNQLPWAKP